MIIPDGERVRRRERIDDRDRQRIGHGRKLCGNLIHKTDQAQPDRRDVPRQSDKKKADIYSARRRFLHKGILRQR